MLPCIWVNSKQIFLTLQIDLCVYSNRGRLILNFLVARKCIFTFNLFTQTYSDVLKLYNGHQANSKWLDYNHPCSKHQSMATNNIQNTFQSISSQVASSGQVVGTKWKKDQTETLHSPSSQPP